MRRSVRPLALIAASILAACGPAPSSAQPSSAASPSSAAVFEWTPIDLQDDVLLVGAVATTSTGFVIAGSSGDGGAAWSSHDGVEWLTESLAGPRPRVGDVVGFGDEGRAVILADAEIGPPCARGTGLAIWLGNGAGSWTEAPMVEAFCDKVAVRLLIIGNRMLALVSNRGDRSTGFLSDTGIRWLEVDSAFPAGPAEAGLATPAGFVVFGTSPTVPWSQQSVDGEIWTAPAALPVPDGSTVAGAAPADGGIVAIVREPAGSVRALGSADGVSWTPMLAEGLAAEGVIRVEPTPFGLVAIGSRPDGTPALWTSANGTSWRAVAIPAEMNAESAIDDVVVGHGLAILVGAAAALDGSVVAWRAPEGILAP